jgi:hypothetical protein
MRTLIRLLALVLLLTFGGCVVPSLQPFYADKDVAFDPTLLGTWCGGEGKETWEFTKHGERGYKLLYTDEDGKQERFVVYRFRLMGNNLLDLYPEEPEPQASDFYKHHLLRLHTFLLVLQSEPTVRITTLDPDWLQRFLANDASALRHQRVAERLILTASTPELQNFILAHLKTPAAFGEPDELIRKKV